MEIRGLFTNRFGKEFTSAAVELRNNCGVNHKVRSDFLLILQVHVLIDCFSPPMCTVDPENVYQAAKLGDQTGCPERNCR